MAYRKYPGVPKTCAQCGGTYLANYYNQNRSKFCGQACSGLASRKPYVDPATIDDIALLREFLSYDPDTGHLTWIKSPSYRAPVGKIAGSPMESGYILFRLRHLDTTCHRVAWAMHHGEWPKFEIDHRNGIRSDNRIINLRPATRPQNSYNQPARGRSGHTGVFKKGKRFRATITSDYKTIYIGTFDTIESAIEARKSKELELGVNDFCGRTPLS